MADALTVSAREFNRNFKKLRRSPLQVESDGELIGTWTPASRTPPKVDFLRRVQNDCTTKLPFTGAQLLKEGKKR